MDLMDAMRERHSVRSYKEKPIESDVKAELLSCIEQCNRESGLHIQLITDEPQAFNGFMAHYGKFNGVTNYIAMIGKKDRDLEEKCGYYGEKIVLKAQTLGLNTCWVALTYSKVKTAFRMNRGEKLCLVIAVGYGKTNGTDHKTKPAEAVMQADAPVPEWFQKGIEAALLAPTAMNQQKFLFALKGNTVTAKAGTGFYTKVDLGIAKYHFEIGSGKDIFSSQNATA